MERSAVVMVIIVNIPARASREEADRSPLPGARRIGNDVRGSPQKLRLFVGQFHLLQVQTAGSQDAVEESDLTTQHTVHISVKSRL